MLFPRLKRRGPIEADNGYNDDNSVDKNFHV